MQTPHTRRRQESNPQPWRCHDEEIISLIHFTSHCSQCNAWYVMYVVVRYNPSDIIDDLKKLKELLVSQHYD
ncbi:hypothetical protein QTP70_001268 [Hemibagrus guttatus]|uniref:Uncharacterized protein n=1 Tax=Hemibagrus guttatus TaxID=175788 RepID=A0AAE0Q5J2_9TELE|nr:hypothetical protein QTP70_001268 [Hemibagrus guttatus]